MSDETRPVSAEKREGEQLRQRLFVALTEQRVIDSQKYGEAPYAPITWEDVDRALTGSDTEVRRLREVVATLTSLLDEPGVRHLQPPNWRSRINSALGRVTSPDLGKP